MSKKEQNKILKVILIVLAIIIIGFISFMLFSDSAKSFEYKGVTFNVVKFCDSGPCLTTYNTKLPVIYKGNSMDYNFYLRNDPRTLEKEVPFEGNLTLTKNMDINITFNTACKGYETIAIENFLKLHRIIGMNVSGDDGSDSCDLLGNRMYLLIQESNKTSVEQFGPACYRINIKECEILEGTERFMIETFAEVDKTL